MTRAHTPSGDALTAALSRYNGRRRPRSKSPDLCRGIVIGMSVPTHSHGISTLYIDRFRLTALVPDPYLVNGGDDAGLPEAFEIMSGESDHRVAVGGGSKEVRWHQPGHVLEGLQRDFGRFGLSEVEALTGVEDVEAYNYLQTEILPLEALLNEHGEPIKQMLHRDLDRRFKEMLKRARQGTDTLLVSALEAFETVNLQAYRFKIAHLKLVQGEILRTRNGASGRTVLSEVEDTWAQEVGFRVDPTIDVVGVNEAIDAYIAPNQQGREQQPVTIVIDESFLKAQGSGVSEAKLLKMLEQTEDKAYRRAMRDLTAQLRRSPEYLEVLAKKAAPAPVEEHELEGDDDVVYEDDDTVVEEQEEEFVDEGEDEDDDPVVEFDNEDGSTETVIAREAADPSIPAIDQRDVAAEQPDEELLIPGDDEEVVDTTGGVDVDSLLAQSFHAQGIAKVAHSPAHKPGNLPSRRGVPHRPGKGKKK